MTDPRRGAHADEAGAVPRERFVLLLALIALVALGLRLGWVIAERHSVPVFDGQFYFGLAKALADGKGFVNPYEYALAGRVVASANHTPTWPLVLTLPHLIGLNSIFASQVFATLVGTSTVVAMGLAGRAMVGPRVGLIAAAMSAVYPNFWVYERELTRTICCSSSFSALHSCRAFRRRVGATVLPCSRLRSSRRLQSSRPGLRITRGGSTRRS